MTDHPTKIGKYKITGVLGEGGMAVVYDGYDVVMDDHVAVKVLKPRFAAQQASIDAFVQEARRARKLQANDHIVTVFEADMDGNQPFIAMRKVEGRTLAQVMAEHGGGPLPVERIRAVVAGVASALETAHAMGILHCDVKPNNILLDRMGRPYLTDFGISRAVGDRLGAKVEQISGCTPQYASPEQAAGLDPTAKSDQYSLGAVLYQMCTGQVPYPGRTTVTELLIAILDESPITPAEVNPHIPPALDAAIRKAMAREPADRFPSVMAFARAVDAATDFSSAKAELGKTMGPLEAELAPGAAASAHGRRGPATRRRGPLLAAGLLLGLALAAGTLAAVWPHAKAGDETPTASGGGTPTAGVPTSPPPRPLSGLAIAYFEDRGAAADDQPVVGGTDRIEEALEAARAALASRRQQVASGDGDANERQRLELLAKMRERVTVAWRNPFLADADRESVGSEWAALARQARDAGAAYLLLAVLRSQVTGDAAVEGWQGERWSMSLQLQLVDCATMGLIENAKPGRSLSLAKASQIGDHHVRQFVFQAVRERLAPQ